MIDERIREALQREPAPEPAAADAWSTFERRARRATLRRGVGLALAVIGVAVIATVVPSRNQELDDRPFVRQPDGRATDGERYIFRSARARVKIPRGWVALGPYQPAGFPPGEGPVTFVPRELARGVAEDVAPRLAVSTFGVVVAVERPRRFEEFVRHQRKQLDAWNIVKSRERSRTIGRRPAVILDLEFGAHRWPPVLNPPCEVVRGCRIIEHYVDWVGSTVVRILIIARDPIISERFLDGARQLIDSFEFYGRGGKRVPQGTVAPSVPLDRPTRALIEFLERRVDGSGAENWLVEARPADAGWLYELGGPSAAGPFYDYRAYDVTSRQQRGATLEYVVSLLAEGRDRPHRERILVGAGEDPRGNRRPFLMISIADLDP